MAFSLYRQLANVLELQAYPGICLGGRHWAGFWCCWGTPESWRATVGSPCKIRAENKEKWFNFGFLGLFSPMPPAMPMVRTVVWLDRASIHRAVQNFTFSVPDLTWSNSWKLGWSSKSQKYVECMWRQLWVFVSNGNMTLVIVNCVCAGALCCMYKWSWQY